MGLIKKRYWLAVRFLNRDENTVFGPFSLSRAMKYHAAWVLAFRKIKIAPLIESDSREAAEAIAAVQLSTAPDIMSKLARQYPN